MGIRPPGSCSKRSGGKLAKRTQDRDAELRGRPKPTGNKTAVFTLVERDGRARSFRMANVPADKPAKPNGKKGKPAQAG